MVIFSFSITKSIVFAKPEQSCSLEHQTLYENRASSEKSSSSEHSINYYEYISPEENRSGRGLKLPTLKQMLQRLPIALAQVKAGNTSQNLLNEIRQIIYFLYCAKEITKKVYNNIMNSMQL